jgi:hypothetical protein
MKASQRIGQILFKVIWEILRLALRILIFLIWIVSNILETILRYSNQILRAYLFNDPNATNMNI